MNLISRISIVGWFACLLGLAFCIQVFVFFNAHSHSVTDLLYAIFPYWAPTGLGCMWIVEKTLRPKAA